MAQCDCRAENGRISFEQFKVMMRSRTEREMMLDHMFSCPLSVCSVDAAMLSLSECFAICTYKGRRHRFPSIRILSLPFRALNKYLCR